MTKRWTAILLVVAGAASAAEMPLTELPEDKLLGLAPMLSHGEIALIESGKDGRLKQVTVMALVGAAPSLVREVITSPERYKDFGHNLSRAAVRHLPNGSIDYDFSLDLGVVTLDNNHRMVFRPDGAIAIEDRGPNSSTNYRWRLFPVAGGTLVVQYGYTDIFNSNSYIRRLVTAAPQLEHGLAVTTQLFFVRAVKERAEQLAPPGSFPPADPHARIPGFNFLLERGRIAVIRSRPDGHLGDIAIVDTIYASRARVEQVIADPAQYHAFIEGVKRSDLISDQPGAITYETEFDLSVFDWSTRFLMHRAADGIDVLGLSGDLRGARFRWDLTVRGAKETRAVFRVSQNLGAASPILLGTLFRREPLFEHGLSVAIALLQEVGIRARAEGWR